MQQLANYFSVVGISVSVFASGANAAEKVFSGPQPGEETPPFKVLQVTAPTQAKEIDIDARKKGNLLLVFIHKVNEPAIGLAITLEWYAHQQKKLNHQYVLLTGDKGKAEQLAKRWARRPFFAKAAMSISIDGQEGPGRYGLNRNVLMTVLVAKDGKVVSNFALKAPNNTDAPKILKALAKSIGQPVPSYDKIRAELKAERKRRREKRLRENAVFKLAPNDDLGRLMVSMLYRERINEESVARVVKQLKEWAGKDDKKKATLAKYCKAVLKGKHAKNRYAREVLQKLSGTTSCRQGKVCGAAAGNLSTTIRAN